MDISVMTIPVGAPSQLHFTPDSASCESDQPVRPVTLILCVNPVGIEIVPRSIVPLSARLAGVAVGVTVGTNG